MTVENFKKFVDKLSIEEKKDLTNHIGNRITYYEQSGDEALKSRVPTLKARLDVLKVKEEKKK